MTTKTSVLRWLHICVFAGLLLAGAPARGADVQWTFTDFTSSPAAVRRVVITPIAPYGVNGTSIIIGDRRTYTNDLSGSLIVSNVVVGRSYRVEFVGNYVLTTITNSFDTTVTGFVDAASHLGPPTIRDGGITAFSRDAADARFINTNDVRDFILPGDNVTIQTNASGALEISATGGGVASGPQTNVANYVTPDTDRAIIRVNASGQAPLLSYGVASDTLVFNRPPVGDGSGLTNLPSTGSSTNLIGGSTNQSVTVSNITAVGAGPIAVHGPVTFDDTISAPEANYASANLSNVVFGGVPQGYAFILPDGTLTATNNGGGLTNVAGSGGASPPEVVAIMATNNAATATSATNAPDGSLVGNFLPLMKGDYNPVRLIVDCDFSSDIGEEHGIKITMAMADQGLFKLLAVGNTFTNQYSASYLASFLNYYGYGDVPIGVTRTQRYSAYLNWSNAVSAGNLVTNAVFPGRSFYNTNYPDAVDVYRKALAESPSNSVVFLVEGDFGNVRQLWDSPADRYSPLTGRQLCEAKIKYFFFSAGNTNATDYNTGVDYFGSAVINSVTVPVVWLFANVPTNRVGHNITNPYIHPPDSPLYRGSTNYAKQFGFSVAISWDGYSKSYVAAARDIADGTNWLDGTPLFKLVGPGRGNFTGGALQWSNSIAGLPANQYYLVEGGLNTICTNFINAFIDAPPAHGAGDYRSAVRQFNDRVQVGRPKQVTGAPTTETAVSRFELVGNVASAASAETEVELQFSRPVSSGTAWAEGARFAIGSTVAGLAPESYLLLQLKTDKTSYLDNLATWTSVMGWSGTNVDLFVPIQGAAGSVTSVAYGEQGAANNGMYFPTTTSVGIVSGGTESIRYFGASYYQASGGAHVWSSAALGASADLGLRRSAAGELSIYDGVTTAVLRDVRNRTLYPSNIVFTSVGPAQYVLPAANGVSLFSSNAFLYSIHNLAGTYTTNLIKAP